MTRFPQLDLEPTRAVAAFIGVKDGHYFRFSGRFLRAHRPTSLHVPPSVVAAGHDPEHLAELLDGMEDSLLVKEVQRAHYDEGCEKTGMAFFNISSSWASRLLAARSARTSAASAGSAGKGNWAAFCQA